MQAPPTQLDEFKGTTTHVYRSGVLATALCLLLAFAPANASGLRVENANEVAIAVAEMTPVARDLGITRAAISRAVTTMLESAGLKGRPSRATVDGEVLLVDVVVTGEAFYVSMGFWRIASYSQPGGETDTGFVTVWQDYSVGTHKEDAASVYATISAVADRFITEYRSANELEQAAAVAGTP